MNVLHWNNIQCLIFIEVNMFIYRHSFRLILYVVYVAYLMAVVKGILYVHQPADMVQIYT